MTTFDGGVPLVGGKAPKRKAKAGAKIRGEGLVARFAPIKGITPHKALDRRIYLPAWLNTFTVAETALHNEYDTLSAGQFSQPAMGPPSARQLRTLSADTITVDYNARWLTVINQEPGELRNRLHEILRARKPVHLLVNFHPRHGRAAELDMYCTFRGIDKDVRPGENDARYLTIAISEWRDPSGQVRSSAPNGSSRKHGVSLPTTHVLKAGDTLSSLSQEYYGSHAFWRDIRDANGITRRFGQKTPVVTLPGPWKVGYKIKIPRVKWALVHTDKLVVSPAPILTRLPNAE